MKIVIFLPHLAVGGVERSSFNLAEQLFSMGHDVTVLTVGDPEIQHLELPENVMLKRLNYSRVLLAIPGVARYLAAENVDVFISAQTYANVAALVSSRLARSGVKVILTERLAVTASTVDMGRVKRYLMKHLIRWIYPRADAVVGNSRAVLSDLVEKFGVPPDNGHVIYNAANIEKIRALSLDRDEPGKPGAVTSSEVVNFVAVGRLVAQKDYPTQLRAFSRALKKLTCTLTIVGDGPDRAILERMVAELEIEDDVFFMGEVSNPYLYMRSADILVLSSLYEGLPNVLIEAQALGIPIVATDAPGGSREVLLDGQAGLLVPVKDPGSLANAMIEAATNRADADDRVRKGTIALERFVPSVCASKYLELVESV